MFPLYYSGLGNRDKNQDFYFNFYVNNSILLLGVTDGVGGNAGGEIASKLAISSFKEKFIDLINLASEEYSISSLLENSFLYAHTSIIKLSEGNIELSKMATTMTIALINDMTAYIIHAGDSRAYLLRNKGVKQLTIDDTEVNKLFMEGKLSKEQKIFYPRKHILTNALGIKENFSFKITKFALEKKDRLLLLTDGFYQEVTKPDFCQISYNNTDFSNFFFESVLKCKEKSPSDNFTLVGVEID